MTEVKECPWCGEIMSGEPGSRACMCGAYEVDTDDPASYDVPRNKKRRRK